MGQGAHVTITNTTQETFTVSYPSDTIQCLYNGGDDGSDLGPITGTLGPGATLPATGGHQYIESISSGECKFETTTLGMLFVDGAENSAVVAFSEEHWAWSVAQSQYQIGTSYIQVQVTDNGRGSIDTIQVTVSQYQ